jgi:hypothetical protein
MTPTQKEIAALEAELANLQRIKALRAKVNLAIAKTMFKLLPKREQDQRASKALKTIQQLINK